MINFKISENYIQLNSLLKATGLCGTGGMATAIIDDGLVFVNGNVEYRRRYKARIDDTISYNNNTIKIVKE